MMRNRMIAVLAAIGTAALLLTGAGAQGGSQTLDLRSPGPPGSPGPVYSAGGVTLERSASGLAVSVRLPTPESGSYTYPEGAVPGRPETFTGWLIVFNYPELCNGRCDGDDLGTDAPAQGGGYLIGGQIGLGSTLSMSRQIATGTISLRPGGRQTPLREPLTAEVHVSIAPHGEYDPSDPSQLTTPIGSPSCECWWTAFFLTSAEGPGGLPSAGSGGLADAGPAGGLSPVTWALIAAGAAVAIQLPTRRLLRRWRGDKIRDAWTPRT